MNPRLPFITYSGHNLKSALKHWPLIPRIHRFNSVCKPRHLSTRTQLSSPCYSYTAGGNSQHSHSRTGLSWSNTQAASYSMASLGVRVRKHKVAIIGSGNWGSAIAKIVAENTRQHPQIFETDVQMWVFEEEVMIPKESKHYRPGGTRQKLTSIINEYHENVKYLTNIPLPTNLIANPSIEDSVRDASILIFNLPHQFISKTCDQLKGKILPYARGISCIKGVDVTRDEVKLFSDSIGSKLGIYCGALSGANIANEVAEEKWSETTVAYDAPQVDSRRPSPKISPSASSTDLAAGAAATSTKLHAVPEAYPVLNHENVKKLFHRPYFHVRMTTDVAGVSLGGALKNVVALAAGFVVGLGWGDNAKAAVMRVGIQEQVAFGRRFFPDGFQAATMTEESCGVADMITSCSGGRNFRCAKMSVEKGLSIEQVEKEELNGQKLQGTSTAAEVNSFLKARGCESDFPLFTAVHNILVGINRPQEIPKLILNEEDNDSRVLKKARI